MSWLPNDPAPLREVFTLQQAATWQEAFVAAVTRQFHGDPGLFGAADVGMAPELGRPAGTAATERVLADAFGAEASVLVRGAGSGAVRLALFAAVPAGATVLAHRSPTYLTSRLTLDAMGVTLFNCDFNDLRSVEGVCSATALDAVLIQHMRPRPEDRYELAAVCEAARRASANPLRIISDDNYAALRLPKLGVELGADLSAFSLFKLGGPAGIGCVLGTAELVEQVRPFMLSGGSVVQGSEAVAVLQALARAALPMAHQARVTLEVARRLDAGEVAGIERAFATNTPETTVLVELADPLAGPVRDAAAQLGAAVRPVGMESFHEIVPAFLRPSKSMIEEAPGIEEHVLRISAMRAGADLVIDLLATAIASARPGR